MVQKAWLMRVWPEFLGFSGVHFLLIFEIMNHATHLLMPL